MRLSKQIALHYIRTKFGILSAISKRKAAARAFALFTTPQRRPPKTLPPLFEKAEKLTTAFDGIKVRGYRWNYPALKKILILHGYESTAVNFEAYVLPLTEKGYEVLAFDAPAHGRSDGTNINVLIYKNFIHHIATSYGPVNNFIAHSLGGLGLGLYLEEAAADKVVLIAPAMETTTAVDHYFNSLQMPVGLRPFFDAYITSLTGEPPEWFSLRRAAAGISAHVLLLQDEEDYTTPYKDVKPLIEKGYPNFQFIISKGLGHRRIYRDPDSIKAIMAFL